MTTVTGRPAMRSPGRPPIRRESERRFWLRIAEGLSSEDAAAACGVSPAVGNRWFRQGGGMPPMSLVPPSGRYLSFREREEIALLRAQEMTLREIAAQTNTKQRSTLTQPMRTLAPSSKLETANRASNEPGDLHPAGCRAWMRGCCWLAVDTRLGRDVALKVQQFDPAGDRVAFERFQREAQSAAGLQHPNVVTIFDSGIDGDTAFLVMELLPGPTLEAYVAERGPLPEREAVALAAAVASGLSAAHRAGVVHRDIKPTNLMFDARGGLKLVDFGIARLAQTAAARLTATNTVVGSALYLSPEQLTGGPAEERSDLYALGCVMTTMLTGRPPFEGEHPLALLNQHVNAVPPPLSERRPGINPALEVLAAQLLAKSPQDRPQSALAVHDRLSEIEFGSPAEHSGVSQGTTAGLAQATRPLPVPVTTLTASAPADRPRSGQGRWIAGGAAALTLMAVLLI